MTIGQTGLDFIKRHEGLRLQSYQDVAGVWTIGYGHTGTARPNQTITEQQAEDLLRIDLQTASNAVNKYVIQKGVELNQNQFDALVSFTFNLGVGYVFTKKHGNAYSSGSTLYNRILNGDFDGAADSFLWYDKAGGKTWAGLTKRRKEEQALFKKKSSSVMASAAVGSEFIILAVVGGVLYDVIKKLWLK